MLETGWLGVHEAWLWLETSGLRHHALLREAGHLRHHLLLLLDKLLLLSDVLQTLTGRGLVAGHLWLQWWWCKS